MTRNEIQKAAIKAAFTENYARLIIVPRVGKTKIGIDIIKKMKPKKILWVTPTSKLAQFDIPEEFTKWRAKTYLKKTKIITWRSLHKETGHYDLIILDEEQKITINNSKRFFDGTLTYSRMISMTGTETENWDKQILYKRLKLVKVIEIGADAAIKGQVIADYKVYIVEIPVGSDKVKGGSKNKPFLIEEYKNIAYLERRSNQDPSNFFFQLAAKRAISTSPSKLDVFDFIWTHAKGKKLGFLPFTNQGLNFTKSIYNGKTDDTWLKKFNKDEVDNLILTNKGGIGYTYRGIKHLILFQAGNNSEGLSLQKLYRTLLEQGNDYVATIWILELQCEKDPRWVKKTLKSLDQTKIYRIDLKTLKKILYAN